MALRAERAFGVRSVRAPQTDAQVQAPAGAPKGALEAGGRATRSVAAIASATSTSSASADLFGNSTKVAPTLIDATGFGAPVLSRSDKVLQLKLLNEGEVSVCRKCRLCEQRTNTVFGEG